VRVKKVFILSFILSLFVLSFSFSETIILKSGKQVKARILEKTDEYIKVDFYGVELTYFSEDILEIKDSLDQQNIPSSKMIKMTGLGTNPGNKNDELPSVNLNSEKKHFLWKIHSATNVVYLLGSIHMGTSDMYPLDRVIETAFNESQVLVVEANITDSSSYMNDLAGLADSLINPSSNLQDRLSTSTYSLFKSKLDKMSFPIEYFSSLEPWVLAITLEMMEFQKMGFDPKYGIDNYFLEKSQGRKKIVELESIDYQLGIFKSFSDKEQDVFLLSTLLGLDKIENLSRVLINAWKTGDVVTLQTVMAPDPKVKKNLESVNKKLYGVRNFNMTEKIDNFIGQDKNYFVVVGAGHLVGTDGIVTLLKEKGHLVDQL